MQTNWQMTHLLVLEQQLMTCIAADHDIGQPSSYHHHCAIFLRDTKKF